MAIKSYGLAEADASADDKQVPIGRAVAALIVTVALVAIFSLAALVGAYQYARDYGADTLVSLLAAAIVVGVFATLWVLGPRVTRAARRRHPSQHP
jgi:uncharacterized membrane protein